MKVFIAIPAYDRKISVETARSLWNEQAVAAGAGVDLQVSFAPGNSLITHARNQCVRDFIQSGADRLVFVDSDVAWEPGDLIKLAMQPEDFVGGAYRYKDDKVGYPVHFLTQSPQIAENGLIQVGALPAGFLALTPAVFHKLFAATRGEARRAYSFFDQTFYAYFHCPFGDGEDGAFCADWRAIEGKVWMHPGLTLTHVDAAGRKYTGNIGQWLKAKKVLVEALDSVGQIAMEAA